MAADNNQKNWHLYLNYEKRILKWEEKKPDYVD